MKILVTGAAGFIGSHVAEALLERGDEVVGLDNFNDYYDPARKRDNAALLARHERFRMAERDLRDREGVRALVLDERPDAVAHIAGMAGVRNSVENPDLYVQVNVNGSQNLMDAVRESGGARSFVFAGTSSSYADTDVIPFVETDACDRPLQPYAASKRATEILGHAYHYLYDLPFTSVRFFTVYGPRGRPDMMPFKLADSIARGRRVPLYEGESRRDWTYVSDIADGVVRALDRPLGYAILNLGRGEPVSLTEFIAEMERVAGRRANLYPAPRPSADMETTFADITLAREKLGYEPRVAVAEGVRRFWDWYLASELGGEMPLREAGEPAPEPAGA